MAQDLTIDELAAAVGLSVRTTRYYASLGLIPTPTKRGRIAYYGDEHLGRLQLVIALQAHGFTLQAIERYIAKLPDDITVEDIAMQRSMIMSWTTEDPEEVNARIGRELLHLGLPRDALAAAHKIIETHMQALADELRLLVDDQVVDPWQRRQHTTEEASHLAEALPRLQQLTVESIVASFQAAVNGVILRSLGPENRDVDHPTL
jgi:DNA-binding transcriptional MerR regulator